jgi:hypothetical protein
VRAGGAVTEDQQMTAMHGGDLRDHVRQHGEVVGGGVRAGVARPQLDGEQLIGVVASHQTTRRVDHSRDAALRS